MTDQRARGFKQMTNILRLRLRGKNIPGTCECFDRTVADDGVKIAHDTIGAICDFKTRQAGSFVLSGMAITITMALNHAISILLNVLDEESDGQEEPEGISGVVEEGYAVLMDLAPTCEFANSATLSLNARLFSSDDGTECPSPKPHVVPSITSNTPSNQDAVESLVLDEPRDTSMGISNNPWRGQTQTTGWNSLLDDLQAGYSDLDTASPGRIQGSRMVNMDRPPPQLGETVVSTLG